MNPPQPNSASEPQKSRSQSTSLKLGDMMVRDGLLTSDGLQKALAIQKQGAQSGHYKPLGQVCLDLRLITRQDLQRFLSRYHKHIQIGELLMNMGLINKDQVERILEMQRHQTGRFGTLLVRAGIITESQLTDALSMQLGIPRIVPLQELISPDLLEGLEESFVRKYVSLPVHRQGNQIVVVMADPLNSDAIEALINKYKCKVVTAIAPASEILATINEIFIKPKPQEAGAAAEPPKRYPAQTPGEPPPKDSGVSDHIHNLGNVLLRSAVEAGATTLHIESHEHYLRVRLRVDGVLRHLTDLPLELGAVMGEMFKSLCQGQTIDCNARARIGNTDVGLRLSTLPTRWGESLVIHVFEPPAHLLGLENLGLSPLNLKHYTRLLDQAGGVLFAVGPARSGKASLLAASLDYLNSPGCAIVAMSNPLSLPIQGLIEVSTSEEHSMNARFQAMLAQDADIMMVNELADRPTADFIGQASLQGRKIFSALSACDATTGLFRLMQLQAKGLLESPLPLALISQRLVRRLCENCKQPHSPTDEELRHLNLLPTKADPFPFYQAKGCPECNEQGFRGITALQEILVVSEAMRDALLQGHSAASLRRMARSEGQLVSMAEDGIYKALQGLTSLEEVRRVVVAYPDKRPAKTQKDIYALCQGEG